MKAKYVARISPRDGEGQDKVLLLSMDGDDTKSCDVSIRRYLKLKYPSWLLIKLVRVKKDG